MAVMPDISTSQAALHDSSDNPGVFLRMAAAVTGYFRMYTWCTIFTALGRPPSFYNFYHMFNQVQGGFLFGFDTGNHNFNMIWHIPSYYFAGSIGPVTVMHQFKMAFGPISPVLQGLIVSSILLTASIASLFAGPISGM